MIFYLTNNNLENLSALLRIRSSDAYTFIAGQITQAVSPEMGRVAYGLWLSVKGRPQADGFVLTCGVNDLLVVSWETSATALLERFQGFIIADDVTVENETAQWSRVAVWGEGASGLMQRLFGAVPEEDKFLEGSGVIAFRGRLAREESFELLVPRDAGAAWEQKLQEAGARESDAEAAARSRILAGIPAVPADIGPNDLPQESELGDTAVSYAKGCYLGQEVMSRLKHLGTPRRKLVVIRSATALASGAELFQQGKKVGDVRSVARDGETFVALAMITLLNYQAEQPLNLSAGGDAVVTRVRDA